MRLLVTGGAGFIGSHIVDAALRQGNEVAVLDNLSHGRRENVAKEALFFEADLRDDDAMRRVFAAFRPDAVSHQAAQASVTASVRDPLEDAQINVVGTLRLLALCREYTVQRLVFASTGGAIYGEVAEGQGSRRHGTGGQGADESTPPRPSSPYAISKLAAEHYLEAYRIHYGLDSVVLRYANVYGPRQDAHGEAGVVAIFLSRLLQREPLRIFGRAQAGDGGCIRDYVFVGDVVRANLLALAPGPTRWSLLNVGTGVPTSTAALAELLRAETASDAPFSNEAPRAGDLQRSVLDPQRCIAAIGAPMALAEGLRLTTAWYRDGFNSAVAGGEMHG